MDGSFVTPKSEYAMKARRENKRETVFREKSNKLKLTGGKKIPYSLQFTQVLEVTFTIPSLRSDLSLKVLLLAALAG